VIFLLVSVFLFHFHVLLGIALAVGLFFALNLMFSEGPRRGDLPEEMSAGEVRRILAEAHAKVARIRDAAAAMPKSAIRAPVGDICAATDRILADFKEDPSHLRAARFFLNYVLDTTLVIVDRYAYFTTRRLTTADKSLAKIEAEVLPAVAKALQQLEENLQKDNLLDLEVTIAVLKQTLELEGMG
jgi:hypothetical protein